MEQKSAYHADQAQRFGKAVLIRAAERGNAIEQHAQIQNVLVYVGVLDEKAAVFPFVEGSKEVGPAAEGGQGGLTGSVSAVCPLGEMLAKVKICGIGGIFLKRLQAFFDGPAAELGSFRRIHARVPIGIEIEPVIPAVCSGSFLHSHGQIRDGGDAGTQDIFCAQFIDFLYRRKDGNAAQSAEQGKDQQRLLSVSEALQERYDYNGDDQDQVVFAQHDAEGQEEQSRESAKNDSAPRGGLFTVQPAQEIQTCAQGGKGGNLPIDKRGIHQKGQMEAGCDKIEQFRPPVLP